MGQSIPYALQLITIAFSGITQQTVAIVKAGAGK